MTDSQALLDELVDHIAAETEHLDLNTYAGILAELILHLEACRDAAEDDLKAQEDNLNTVRKVYPYHDAREGSGE